MRAEELLTRCDHALIAFDGPIAELPAVFAGRLRTMWPTVGRREKSGAREALATMAAAGTQVTVVSGLALRAVRTFLVIHGLLAHVKHLACRTGPDPAAPVRTPPSSRPPPT